MFVKKTILFIFIAVLSITLPMSVFAVTSYEVTTYSATNTCKNGATLNGYVNPFFTTDTNRWFEWGTSQDSLPNGTNQTRNGSNTEYFSQDLVNLAPNTTYYFRVVAQNSKGTGRGEVLSFKTDGSVSCTTRSVVSVNSSGSSVSGTGTTNTSYVSQSVITKRATDIIDMGARLNAVALPIGFTQTYGWFEWGSTPDFGRTTARQSLGSGNSILWSDVVSGLTPGTTYFFKPVIENQNGVSEGVLFSFRTSGTAPVVPVVSSASSQTASAVQSIVKTAPKPVTTASVVNKKTTDVKTAKDTIGIVVIPSTETAALKERVSETIQFENTTGATLKNVAVRVVLPCNAEYIPTAGGDSFLQTGQMLTHEVGDVKPNQKVSLLLWTGIGANTPDKTPIETIAVVNWQDTTASSYTQSVGRSVVTVDVNKVAKESTASVGSAKSASSVFSPIFPASLRDWGAVIGFLFLLFAGYMVFLITRRNNEAQEEILETAPVIPVKNAGLTPVGVPYRKYTNNDPFVTETNVLKSQNGTPIIPVVSTKKEVTEKGAPPENLPI